MWYSNAGVSVQMSNTNITYVCTENLLLPVELTSFTANVKQREVELLWETKTETNTSAFQIERALAKDNAKSFIKVGEVPASGNQTHQRI